MSLYLRKATVADIDLLIKWSSEKAVRQNSFELYEKTYNEHVKQFYHMMNDGNQVQYIMMSKDDPVGQIRLTINGAEADIAYSVSSSSRGYGDGEVIISLVIRRIKNDYPNITKLIGKVKKSEVDTYYCYIKNGFEEILEQMELDISGTREMIDFSAEHQTEPQSEGDCTPGGLKVLFLTNNKNTLSLFRWISDRSTAEIYSERVDVDLLCSLMPDLVISYNYIYMISQECIDAVGGRIINMHISLLPWNRGFSPNIWSFIDDTPKGVTIHLLSAGLDEGDILFQDEIDFDPSRETFHTTYQILNDMIVTLFKNNWRVIASGDYKSVARKQSGEGSYHTIADLKKLQNTISFKWTDNIDKFMNRYKAIQQNRAINGYFCYCYD